MGNLPRTYECGDFVEGHEDGLDFLVGIEVHLVHLLHLLHKGEEEFLDRCSDYCTTHVVGRLRIMEFDQQVE